MKKGKIKTSFVLVLTVCFFANVLVLLGTEMPVSAAYGSYLFADFFDYADTADPNKLLTTSPGGKWETKAVAIASGNILEVNGGALHQFEKTAAYNGLSQQLWGMLPNIYTMEFKLKVNTFCSYAGQPDSYGPTFSIQLGNNAKSTRCYLRVESDGIWLYKYTSPTAGTWVKKMAATIDNGWHVYTGVIDTTQSSATVKVYMDGAYQFEANDMVTSTLASTTNALKIISNGRSASPSDVQVDYITVVDGDGSIGLQTTKSSDSSNVQADIKLFKGAITENTTSLLYGVYDSANNLKDIKIQNVADLSAAGIFGGTLSLAGFSAGEAYTVKVFLWDALNGMKPLTAVTSKSGTK